MFSIDTSLMIVFFVAFILMAGILIFREPSQDFGTTLVESIAWGLGLFLALTVQVALLASMS